MKRYIGFTLFLMGWCMTGLSAFVGLSFSAVYLNGFIGTAGREAGGELLFMVTITIVACGLGYGITRFGSRLMRAVSHP